MFINIDHVVIYVGDQRAALDFYVGTLGFELRHCSTGGILYWGYHLSVGLPGSSTTLQLALRPPGDDRRNAPVMLICAELSQTYQALLARGVQFHNHLVGGIEFVSFFDPDGNEFYLSDNNRSWIDDNALMRLKKGIPDGP
ncbi:VOC family protein [Bradyrhizobium sp. SZCCHNR1015]|uniref:VOC family protein n=1 Tax=Bradyrhizobium sp. SZCCHNR1015 TaxID=3057338 RepID=UPI002915E91C|nr:VOC family protein [Bradyrhizobium sp. SZCCHNR1015]